MAGSEMLARLEESDLLGAAKAAHRRALETLSEEEFEVLKSIKERLDEAIGGPEHHSPRDGAVFW